MKRYRVMLFAMVLVLVTPFMAVAGGQEEASATGDDFMEISWLGNPAEETWFELELERIFNVSIEPNGVGRFDGEAQQVMMAAGEFPDTGAPTAFNQFDLYEDGVIRGIPESMFRDHAPNFMKGMEVHPAGLKVWRIPDTDEHVGMTGINDNNVMGVFYLGVRKDYLDAVGVELPNYESTKVPVGEDTVFYYDDPSITLEWLEDVMVKFRDEDPDGNGQNDTIPYAAFTQGTPWTTWAWGPIYGALDVPNMSIERNQMVDGELYAAPVSPNFKEFIKLVTRWWEMDLIDQEWFTINRNTHWELASTGNYGFYCINRGYTDLRATRTPDAITNSMPDGVDFILLAPRGPNGAQHSPMYGTSYIRNQIQVMNRKASDAMTGRVLEIIDTKWAIIDPTPENIDLWMGWRYGKEGVHWEWADQPYEGGFNNITDVPDGFPKAGAFFTAYPNYDPSWIAVWAQKPNFAKFNQNYEVAQFGDQYFATYKIDAFNETDAGAILERKGEALNTLMSEFFTGAINGDVDVDAEWDEYQQTWLDYGGAEYMAEVEKMPLWEDVYGN